VVRRDFPGPAAVLFTGSDAVQIATASKPDGYNGLASLR
jgi:hypothetical protein